MAKYWPNGWKMSAEGERRYKTMYDVVNQIVRARVRKYNLVSIDTDDLMQEGRLAAAYAVDTYKPERGKLEGYISRVVSNALAMIATEALALSRQPYRHIQDADGTWRRTPVNSVELEDDVVIDDAIDALSEHRELACHLVDLSVASNEHITQLNLSADALNILQLRLHTPPELWVLARNINRGRPKLEGRSLCMYLGWIAADSIDLCRYQRAAHELRDQFHIMLGINDLTFEPLAKSPINKHDQSRLQLGAKRRNILELQQCC